MSAERRLIFALGARLGISAAAVERLSAREVAGWVEFFNAHEQASANDGAVDLSRLSREERRAMFHHGRR